MYIPRDPPLVLHLPTSWRPARSRSAEVRLPGFELVHIILFIACVRSCECTVFGWTDLFHFVELNRLLSLTHSSGRFFLCTIV